ncbi:MAG: ExeA family protein [bacterium]
MYEEYFGFNNAPFRESSDPNLLYASEKRKVTLLNILNCLQEQSGHVLLTGETGIGKSISIRAVTNNLPQQIRCAYISQAVEDSGHLVKAICKAFDVEPNEAISRTEYVMRLHDFLRQSSIDGNHAVLVIDNAHNLKAEILEELRMLSDFEPANGKSLQVCLAGQPGLFEHLQQPNLQNLNRKLSERFQIERLELEETGAYIKHRLHLAGHQIVGDLFDESAVETVFSRTQGIPREINTLCENALILGCERNVQVIDEEVVNDAASINHADASSKSGHGDENINVIDQEEPVALETQQVVQNRSDISETSSPMLSQSHSDLVELGSHTTDSDSPLTNPTDNRWADRNDSRKAKFSEMESFVSSNDHPGNTNQRNNDFLPNDLEYVSRSHSSEQPANSTTQQERHETPAPTPTIPQQITIGNRVLEAIAAKTQRRIERALRDKYFLIKKPESNAIVPLIIILVLTYMIAILTTALILKQLEGF